MESTEGFIVLFFLFYIVFLIISMWVIFIKAGKPGWSSIIPIYNLFVLLNIAGKSWWWFFFLIIPFINIIAIIALLHNLSISFGKGIGFTFGLIFLGFLFIPILAFGNAKYVGPGGKPINNPIPQPVDLQDDKPITTDDISIQKPPTILSDLIQPGLIAKIYTIFFMDDCMVFAKTGSGGTDTSGSMRAFHGGAGANALIFSGIGKIIDFHSSQQRGNAAAQYAALNPSSMVSAHKHNFMLTYNSVKMIELKGPNFAGEMKVIVTAETTHKFRVDNCSKSLADYFEKTFNEFLPGKIVRR